MNHTHTCRTRRSVAARVSAGLISTALGQPLAAFAAGNPCAAGSQAPGAANPCAAK